MRLPKLPKIMQPEHSSASCVIIWIFSAKKIIFLDIFCKYLFFFRNLWKNFQFWKNKNDQVIKWLVRYFWLNLNHLVLISTQLIWIFYLFFTDIYFYHDEDTDETDGCKCLKLSFKDFDARILFSILPWQISIWIITILKLCRLSWILCLSRFRKENFVLAKWCWYLFWSTLYKQNSYS